ncbi:MAG: hypothetical protein HOP96_00460 [Sphingomonas sp.]|nr:hypothetical protein [Sphingomonas sp.]
MLNSARPWLLAGLALAAALTAAAAAQNQAPATAEAAQEHAPPLSRDEIAHRLSQSLPAWSDAVLRAPQTPNWTAALRPERVAALLGDAELAAAVKSAPRGSRLFQSANSTLRIDPERGELRYVSRSRTVDPMGQVGTLPPGERASQSVVRALTALGLPRGEFAAPNAVTQISSGGSVRSQAPEVKAEIYRLVTVPRVVGGLPVFVSDARAALTSKGEVQRLRITWPVLNTPRRMQLASREAVIARAADALADHGITARAEIRASLAYVPADAKGVSGYVPAVLISVLEPPTPFIFSVPVVEPAEGDDDPAIG